jgi:uncharacterized protein (DUF1697 family)
MTSYIALLRAVNVGGRNPVAMADLRDLAARVGLDDPRTLLQSGNLVFRSARAAAALERMLESEASARLGLDTDFMVRSAADWQAVIDRNPFPREAKDDPGHLLVMAFKRAPKSGDVKALQAAITGREVVRAEGPHAYLVYPDGVGRSRLTTAVIERTLGTRGTGRNWNTVLKLAALATP